MASTEVLEQICKDCNENYCTVREILKQYSSIQISQCQHAHDDHFYCDNFSALVKCGLSDRVLLQIKCIEEYKWIKSQESGYDIGWNNAILGWIAEGYAEKFANLYSKGMRDIYFFFKEGTVPPRKFHHPEQTSNSDNFLKNSAMAIA